MLKQFVNYLTNLPKKLFSSGEPKPPKPTKTYKVGDQIRVRNQNHAMEVVLNATMESHQVISFAVEWFGDYGILTVTYVGDGEVK